MKYNYGKMQVKSTSQETLWKLIYIFLFAQSVFITLGFYWFTKVFE